MRDQRCAGPPCREESVCLAVWLAAGRVQFGARTKGCTSPAPSKRSRLQYLGRKFQCARALLPPNGPGHRSEDNIIMYVCHRSEDMENHRVLT